MSTLKIQILMRLEELAGDVEEHREYLARVAGAIASVYAARAYGEDVTEELALVEVINANLKAAGILLASDAIADVVEEAAGWLGRVTGAAIRRALGG